MSNCQTVCFRARFGHLSIYAVSIRQKSFPTCKICFKMKYTRNSNNSNIRTGLTISVICDHFQLYFDITDIYLACYSHKYTWFRCIFDALCASNKKKCLSPPTNDFMRKICVYFYIHILVNSKFLHHSQPVFPPFHNSHWLALLELQLWRAEGSW